MLDSLIDWNLVNVAGCSVMLCYAAITAILMPGHGMWGRRIALWIVTALLGISASSPWQSWLPNPTWFGASLNAAIAIFLVVSRQEVMAFIRCRFVVPDPPPMAQMRRLHDWRRVGGAK